MIHCDLVLCVGCRMCEVACSSFHFGAVSPALSRIRVAKLEAIGIDFAISCVGCSEKPCLECPTDALSVSATGTIVVHSVHCNGCESCVEACPIGAVELYEAEPLFCDLCDGEMSCIGVCPTNALSMRDEAVSLERYLGATGRPGEKRARYVEVLAQPLRHAWQTGMRVDS